mgnify:CR=1 FL=1
MRFIVIQVDAAFPLSDHADYDRSAALRRAGPAQAGSDPAWIRGRVRARPARSRSRSLAFEREPNQLELTSAGDGESAHAGASKPSPAVASLTNHQSSASSLELGEQIAATPAKLEKVRLLSDYLRSLAPDQLRIAAIFLTGKAFAQTDQRTLQAGWAIIYRALLEASGRGNAELRRIASSHGDASKAAFEALEGPDCARAFFVRRSESVFRATASRPVGRPVKPNCCELACESFAARSAIPGQDSDRRPAHRSA